MIFKIAVFSKKGRVSGTVAEMFELATDRINQEAFADEGPSAEFVPVKGALGTAQVEAMEDKKKLALL